MILDLSFRNAIQKFFESCEIQMSFINISPYYEFSMQKNPIKLIKKGIREIDIMLTVPGIIQSTGIISLVDSVILFFDKNIMDKTIVEQKLNEKHCYLIEKASIWAIMSAWKVTDPSGSVYFTYKGVHEVRTNTVLKMKGLSE